MLIQEVILENFMSYEYARVSLKHGVNVVCGPNGSGKSSLLLGISIALGQSYTERSKKLSDLIRWGKDQARVTLILDNSEQGKKRPVPKFRKDQILLTRILRRDSKYWFELNNRAATKQDVKRLLGKLGVDPDNMLIIMHQSMVEQFIVLSTSEKLQMVEAAVGFEPYRENVLQAQRKLTRILSQEESISKLLESSEQTLNYWREQYTRYQEKKQLETKKRFLEREQVWAEISRIETAVKDLERKRRKEQQILDQIDEETKKLTDQLQVQQNHLNKLKNEWKRIFNERLNLECERAENESTISLYRQLLKEIGTIEMVVKKSQTLFKLLNYEHLRDSIEKFNQRISELSKRIKINQDNMKLWEKELEKIDKQFLSNRIRFALLEYQKENIEASLKKLKSELNDAKAYLTSVVKKAEQSGPRIAVLKSADEILDEIRVTDGHLSALSDVSEKIERMYESYSKLYLELKEKAQLVAENREKTLKEVKTRIQAWRTVMQSLLDRVNLEYQKILAQTQAIGEVRLSNGQDIETVGLQILVGFKGGKKVPLDAYTQSGGERTTATMSFLLALQQHVRSPFRAVDEYDIHMDPRNREMIAKTIISTVKNANAQYVIITPSQVTFSEEANIITVQNVEGESIVKEVA